MQEKKEQKQSLRKRARKINEINADVTLSLCPSLFLNVLEVAKPK